MGPSVESGETVMSFAFVLSGVPRVTLFLRSFSLLIPEELGDRGCFGVGVVTSIAVFAGDGCRLKWVEIEGGLWCFRLALPLPECLELGRFLVCWRSTEEEVERGFEELLVVMIGKIKLGCGERRLEGYC